jgi:hypothetical protein
MNFPVGKKVRHDLKRASKFNASHKIDRGGDEGVRGVVAGNGAFQSLPGTQAVSLLAAANT